MAWDKVRASNASLKARLAESMAARSGLQRVAAGDMPAMPAPHAPPAMEPEVAVEPAPQSEIWIAVDASGTEPSDNTSASTAEQPDAAWPEPDPISAQAAQADPHATMAGPVSEQSLVEDDGREKRRAPRKVHALSAQIHVSPASPGIPCMVADMSATGARIKLIGSSTASLSVDDLPQRITLYLKLDRTQVDCEIVRRETEAFGVRFLTAPAVVAAPPKRATAAKQPTKKKSWF